MNTNEELEEIQRAIAALNKRVEQIQEGLTIPEKKQAARRDLKDLHNDITVFCSGYSGTKQCE